jgi:hypothetical protein
MALNNPCFACQRNPLRGRLIDWWLLAKETCLHVSSNQSLIDAGNGPTTTTLDGPGPKTDPSLTQRPLFCTAQSHRLDGMWGISLRAIAGLVFVYKPCPGPHVMGRLVG